MVTLMNTFLIYEQFRTVLGEEGAKGFAQTLGTMFEEARNAATKDDIRGLRESVDTNIDRLEAAVTNLAQAQARTESRVEELAATMTSFANILNQLVIRSDRHEGSLLELRFRDRLPS